MKNVLLVVCLAAISSHSPLRAAIPRDSILAGLPIRFYLSHAQIPQVCKDLYLGKRRATDDNDILALMDSLFTKNRQTRAFYFLTLTRTFKKADGAYAEPLGIMAKKFVETHPREFLNYFLNEPAVSSANFDEWAHMVCSEIGIMAENHEQDEIQELRKTMKAGCISCNEKQTQKLETFVLKIKKHCTSPG